MFTTLSTRLVTSVICGAVLLTACESDATLPGPDFSGTTGEVTIDATSSSAFAFLDLESASVVAVSDPSSSTAWDIGVRRYEMRLNGGMAGPGSVAAYLLTDHSADAPATLVGRSAASQLAEFEAVTSSQIPPATSFGASELVNDPSSWFTPAGQTLVANPARTWKLRRADGTFAVLRVAELGFTGGALSLFRVEYRLQGADGSLGSIQSASIIPGAPGAPARLSLATGEVTTTSGCTWDIAVDAALTVTLNGTGGCQAGTFPIEATVGFDAVSSASDAPAYGSFLAALSSPIPNSIDAADSPPFIYGIDPTNPHRLVPTFNIYLVRRGDAVYKVQFLSYYSPIDGTSGQVSVRVGRLR